MVLFGHIPRAEMGQLLAALVLRNRVTKTWGVLENKADVNSTNKYLHTVQASEMELPMEGTPFFM